jgi:hypothetical protein
MTERREQCWAVLKSLLGFLDFSAALIILLPYWYIPDLRFAILICRNSGCQLQREILLLIILQLYRHIMVSPYQD